MTKKEIITGIIIGFMLGTMALLILSFTSYIDKAIKLKNLELNSKKELINKAKKICSEYYPTVITTIENGIIITECRTEQLTNSYL